MKIGIIGNGKMGAELQDAALEKRLEVTLPDTVLREEDQLSFPSQPDILIDFSHPDNLDKLLSFSLSNQLPLVIGTTGYTKEQLQAIKDHAQHVPVLYSANFSLGIMVMNQLVGQAAALLHNWQIELIEKHHSQKKDAPSGTAEQLLHTIQNVRNLQPIHNWQGKKREEEQIGVHSIRAGSFPGEHEVLFAGPDEVFTIKHEAFSSRIFALGALQAASWLKDQSPGSYKLEDLLINEGV